MVRQPFRNESWIALDLDHAYRLVYDSEGYLSQAVVYHRIEDGSWCSGWLTFQGPWQDGWSIEQREPLTLSPSILCTEHGDNGMTHGFIREGIWVPAGPMPDWA